MCIMVVVVADLKQVGVPMIDTLEGGGDCYDFWMRIVVTMVSMTAVDSNYHPRG